MSPRQAQDKNISKPTSTGCSGVKVTAEMLGDRELQKILTKGFDFALPDLLLWCATDPCAKWFRVPC